MILQYQIDKYASRRTINCCVYRLSYAGKYIIVKGKTLAGSLFLIQKGFSWYKGEPTPLYGHFYQHIQENPDKRFRIRILSHSKNHYTLLKREQIELDKGRYDGRMLNNQLEAYIPLFNEVKGTYGTWIEKQAVMNFRKYLNSHKRKLFLREIKAKLAA